MRRLLRWVLPGGVVAALAAMLIVGPLGSPEQSDLARTVVERYAPIVYGAAAVLAVAFHRSRVLVLVLALGLVELAARLGPVAPELVVPVAAWLAVLLGLGAVAPDRGAISTVGLAQVAFGVGGTAGLLATARFRPDLLGSLGTPGDPASWAETTTGLPDVVMACALVGSALAGLALYRQRGPVERAALWSLAMVVAGAHPRLDAIGASLLHMGAGLTLGLAVLETSYAMAYRDELTGLPSRRSLLRDLESLTGTYTLAMVDVDHFKKFNDRHGHDVGDQVLRMVAGRLARAPGGGRAYRYGGEEFTLLFRDMDRDEAAPHLEAVRASVASARFSLRRSGRPVGKDGKARRGKGDGRKLSVTVSIGMAHADDGGGERPEAVLTRADKALYKAKRAGRDRVSR